MATTPRDPELMARLKSLAEAAHKGENQPKTKAEAAKIVPTEMLAHATSDKTKMFSEVFGFKPKIPDFPVTIYEADDWDVSIQARIPDPDPNYVFNKNYLEQFMFGLYIGGPVMLYGPTGTGKTSLARQIASIIKMPFLRVGCHRQMEASEFLGTTQVINDKGVPITRHNDTDTTLAARYGGMLCVDEAFRSPILMAIQSLLEQPALLQLQDCQGMQSTLRPPSGKFSIVLTDNTNGTGDSSGVYIAESQDLSTLARINTAVFVDYQTPSEEIALLQKAYPNINKPDAAAMCDVAKKIREAFVGRTIMQVMDIRALLNWAKNYSYIGNMEKAFKLAFLSKLGPEDMTIVNSIYRSVIGKDV